MTKRALPSSSFWGHLQVYGGKQSGNRPQQLQLPGQSERDQRSHRWQKNLKPIYSGLQHSLEGEFWTGPLFFFFKGFYFLFHICRGSVGGFVSFERFGPRLSRASLLSQSLSAQIKDARGRMLLGWFLMREEGEVRMLSQDGELWSASTVTVLFLYDNANLRMFQVQ